MHTYTRGSDRRRRALEPGTAAAVSVWVGGRTSGRARVRMYRNAQLCVCMHGGMHRHGGLVKVPVGGWIVKGGGLEGQGEGGGEGRSQPHTRQRRRPRARGEREGAAADRVVSFVSSPSSVGSRPEIWFWSKRL